MAEYLPIGGSLGIPLGNGPSVARQSAARRTSAPAPRRRPAPAPAAPRLALPGMRRTTRPAEPVLPGGAGVRPGAERVRPESPRARVLLDRRGPEGAALDEGGGTARDGSPRGAAGRASREASTSAVDAKGRKVRGDRPRAAGAERLVLVLLGAVGLGLAAAALFAAAPQLFRVTRVEVSGALTMSREEVIAASLLPESPYLFSVDPARLRAALMADPRVREALVRRRFPNGLVIAVEERRAVAGVVVEDSGRPAFAEIDAEGVAFRVARPGEAPAAPVPVLSGIRFEDFRVGTRLPASFATLLASLARVQASKPALLDAFSEIRVVRTRFGDLELLLYPLRQRMPVRTGPDLNEDALRSIILVLDVLASRLGSEGVEEIDFRAGTVVYRAKEGHPG